MGLLMLSLKFKNLVPFKNTLDINNKKMKLLKLVLFLYY